METETNSPELRLVQVRGQWYAHTQIGVVGPLTSPDEAREYVDLLDLVAAARGQVGGNR